MEDRDRYFRTTSLQLAIFLYAKSPQIAGITPTDSSKMEFVFVPSDYLTELVDKYKFGSRDDEDLLVPVHFYEHARNELLDRLNDR